MLKPRKVAEQRKRNQQTRRSADQRFVRSHLIEHLERRDLMAGDLEPWTDGYYYPKIGKAAALLPQGLISQTEYNRRSDITEARRSQGGGGGTGEAPPAPFNTNELENNDRLSTANPLPLGTAMGKNPVVNVTATLSQGPTPPSTLDQDYFRFELRAGDVIDAQIVGSLLSTFDLSFLNSSGAELIGNDASAGGIYPEKSPLFDNPLNTSLAFVIPADGTYYARVGSDVAGNYQLQLRAYRPFLESEPIGTKQIIYIDFDGAIVNRAIWGVPGTARFSPLSDFVPNWGLEPEDEDAVIDSVMAVIRENLEDLTTKANNGYYSLTGEKGDFDFDLRNSRDHADPFGERNVSRVIIGGTVTELLITTIGLAQSIDVGNFDTEETGIVLLDLLSIADPTDALFPNSANSIPLSGSATRIDVVGQLVGNIATHEFGHYLGNWHVINTNFPSQIMDTGGNIAGFAGVGRDGIFGTADDQDVDFGVDRYDANASAIAFGTEDTINTTAFAMSTGTIGGEVIGTVFHDRNRNAAREVDEEFLAGVTVYADVNDNGVRNVGEPTSVSRADGKYTLGLAPGTYKIRSVPLDGYVVTTPSNNVRTVTVALNQTVTVPFGHNRPDQTVTGYKWSDLNGDGIRDLGEPPLQGIYIYIDLDGDDRIDLGEPTGITAADGSYRITPPSSGSYAVREVVPPGFIQTFPASGEHFVNFNNRSSTNFVGIDFGNRLAWDFGDAPSIYPVTSAQDGASAGVFPNFRFGIRWDIDNDGQPSPNADADDLNGKILAGNLIDDEDGITVLRPIVAGDTGNIVNANLFVENAKPAYVSAWIDFNQDGDWSDAGEKISDDFRAVHGDNRITFSAPAGAILGETFARFRLSSLPNARPFGHVEAGEVEDYKVTIVDKLELAVPDQYSVPRNSVSEFLNVLENDFRLPGETLRVVGVSTGSRLGTLRVAPGGTGVLYTPKSNFVGREIFTYTLQNAAGERSTAQVVVDVEFFLEDPIAVDDSFDVPTNTVGFPLNVLANDLEGVGGALRILSVSGLNKGGSVEIGSGGQSLRYTPARNFGGTETFSYTAVDNDGDETTANVTVHTLTGDRDDDLVGYSFRMVDLDGNPISVVRQDEQFRLEVYVDDLRTSSDPLDPFVINPGVFAAYLDILYSGSLVGPVLADDGTTFPDSIYQDPYTQDRAGRGDLPGLIDDFGAFSRLATMDDPDPLLLASILFEARAPGIADFAGDPADDSPFTDTLLFNLPADEIPVEQLRFGRAMIEIVGDGVEFPFAVDDHYRNIAVNSFDNVLNVMANDSFGTGDFVVLANVTQPINGSAFIDDRGTTDPADDVLRYTPNSGFVGSEQFRYTIRDDRGFESSATVTVDVGNAEDDDLIALRLEITDLSGASITQIQVGQTFQLRGYVDDLRTTGDERGVFSAYQDILYNSGLVTPVPDSGSAGFDIDFDDRYDQATSGDVRNRNIINEVGSVQESSTPLGPAEFLQFIITLQANTIGTATFTGDSADILPIHETLLFDPTDPVPFDQVTYGFDSVSIVASTGGGGGSGGSGNTNAFNPRDVDANGVVTPRDALLVIHDLNRNGSRKLGNNAEGENPPSGRMYFDVDGNGRISPADALLVINYLNKLKTGQGEGEGEGSSNDALQGSIAAGLQSSASSSSKSTSDAQRTIEPRAGSRVYGPVQLSSSSSSSSSVADQGLAGFLSDIGNQDDDEDNSLDSLAADVWSNWKQS